MPRSCRPDERAALVAAASAVFRPHGGDMAAAYPLLFAAGNLAHLRVVEEGGRIVAHAGTLLRETLVGGAPVRVACLGAVFTVPDARGRGLATRLVEDARRRARAAGAALFMISGARGLYARLGFPDRGRFPRWRAPAAVSGAATGDGIALAPVAPADRPALEALHAGERTRFVRSPGDWDLILSARTLVTGPADLWLVRRAGTPAASLAVRGGRALEIAGDRAALVAAAPALAARLGQRHLDLVGAADDDQMHHLAHAAGWDAGEARFAVSAGPADPAQPAPAVIPWYGLDYV